MSNKKTGNAFEKELCNLLAKHGFWAYNFPNKTSGQPADIIASRDGTPCLIDCKVCENDSFDTTRLEENQINSMLLWRETGNGCGYFAFKLQDGTIRFATDSTIRFIAREKRVMNRSDILANSESIEDWLWWYI